MNNPYQIVARTYINQTRFLDDEEKINALALVISGAVVRGQEALRRRAQVFTLELPFDRYEVEHLDNSAAYMMLEAAKALGFGVLDNPAVVHLERKTEDDKVTFGVKCAFLAKEDWDGE